MTAFILLEAKMNVMLFTSPLIVLVLVALLVRKKRAEQKRQQEVIDAFRARNDFRSEPELYWYVAREVVSRLGFSDCVIYRLDADKRICLQAAASGPKAPAGNEIVNPIEIPFGRGIVGTVAVSGKTERLGNATDDPRYIPDDDVRCSELTVPVLLNGVPIAIIDSEEKPFDHFSARDQELLEQVAAVLAEKLAKKI